MVSQQRVMPELPVPMRTLRALLCRLGLHKWLVRTNYPQGANLTCARCGKETFQPWNT